MRVLYRHTVFHSREAERERGHERMESLSELEEFIETLDLTPEEENKIARILEKIRDEATVSA